MGSYNPWNETWIFWGLQVQDPQFEITCRMTVLWKHRKDGRVEQVLLAPHPDLLCPSPSCCGRWLLLAHTCTSSLRLSLADGSLNQELHPAHPITPTRGALSNDWRVKVYHSPVALPLCGSNPVMYIRVLSSWRDQAEIFPESSGLPPVISCSIPPASQPRRFLLRELSEKHLHRVFIGVSAGGTWAKLRGTWDRVYRRHRANARDGQERRLYPGPAPPSPQSLLLPWSCLTAPIVPWHSTWFWMLGTAFWGAHQEQVAYVVTLGTSDFRAEFFFELKKVSHAEMIL